MILKIQFCPVCKICICTLVEEKNHANQTVCCLVTECKMQVFQKTEAAPVEQLRTKDPRLAGVAQVFTHGAGP